VAVDDVLEQFDEVGLGLVCQVSEEFVVVFVGEPGEGRDELLALGGKGDALIATIAGGGSSSGQGLGAETFNEFGDRAAGHAHLVGELAGVCRAHGEHLPHGGPLSDGDALGFNLRHERVGDVVGNEAHPVADVFCKFAGLEGLGHGVLSASRFLGCIPLPGAYRCPFACLGSSTTFLGNYIG
jgi:hypothetical protein